MMENTLYLASLWGPGLALVGLAMLMNPGYYKKLVTDYYKSPALTYFGGAMAFVLGLVLVQYHNVWEGGLATFITVLGWITLVKGVVLVLFPEWAMKTSKRLMTENYLKVASLVALVVGAYLSYLVYLVA